MTVRKTINIFNLMTDYNERGYRSLAHAYKVYTQARRVAIVCLKQLEDTQDLHAIVDTFTPAERGPSRTLCYGGTHCAPIIVSLYPKATQSRQPCFLILISRSTSNLGRLVDKISAYFAIERPSLKPSIPLTRFCRAHIPTYIYDYLMSLCNPYYTARLFMSMS